VGDQLIADRFELERLLGRGGMSEVWLARDRDLDRQVAVKLHTPQAEPARFEREARAAASLSHANVVQIFDYGEVQDRPYLVLEYLPGGTLEDRLAAGEPLPDEESGRIAREVAAGLAHAHATGVVHRDLKPSNVIFDGEGRAKIADFGIARAYGQATLTDAGAILGTAAYMSPEQASGEPVGPASDVYSFGAILFRMLTGRLPFEGKSAIELALKHRSEPAPSVQSRRADAPAALSALVATALAKDPELRPADGGAVLAALAGTGTPVSPSTAATVALADTEPRGSRQTAATVALQRPRAPARRRRLAVLLALGLAAAAAAGLTVALLAFGGGGDGGTPSPAGRAGETAPSLATTATGTTPTGAQTTSTAATTATTGTTQATTTTEETTTPTSTAPATTEATTTP
jgi:eukaryotic-like serine/threonine-protein kinase